MKFDLHETLCLINASVIKLPLLYVYKQLVLVILIKNSVQKHVIWICTTHFLGSRNGFFEHLAVSVIIYIIFYVDL